MAVRRPSRLDPWPEPFDPALELDWGDPTFSRRLLREHLDQAHDGASRREVNVEIHVRRLRRLLPPPPTRILDAACGPGMYAVRLATLGHDVTGVDIGPAVIRRARQFAREAHVEGHTKFQLGDLRTVPLEGGHDAGLLIYHVLEAFPRRDQVRVLRRLGQALAPGAPLIVEMRLRPDQPPGRISSWDVVDGSLLADRRHLLLTDTVWDPRRASYVLREIAVFDDGTTAAQQTTAILTAFDRLPALFERADLRICATYDGWTRRRADLRSDTVLVVARKPPVELTNTRR